MAATEMHPVKQQHHAPMHDVRPFFLDAFCVAGAGNGVVFAWCSFVKWNGLGADENVREKPLFENVRDMLLINLVAMIPPRNSTSSPTTTQNSKPVNFTRDRKTTSRPKIPNCRLSYTKRETLLVAARLHKTVLIPER
jgi:hypothetical protein